MEATARSPNCWVSTCTPWPGGATSCSPATWSETACAALAAGAKRRKKTPHIIATIQRLITHDTGGHPTRGLRWCRTTPAKVADALRQVGIQVGASTVRRLLTGLLGYSLRVNHKKVESGNRNPPKPKVRDAQFHYLNDLRTWYGRQGLPCISVDTKKKELIGNFKNNGRAWKPEPIKVYDHDFPSDAQGKIVPYGIYDTQANHGFVNVATSGDTPALAVDSIEPWWKEYCQRR